MKLSPNILINSIKVYLTLINTMRYYEDSVVDEIINQFF